MKKIIKSILLLAAITTGMVSFVSCSDDDDLTTADALFRPIISESDNIVQGLDENLVPYVIVKWDNYTSANQYTVKMEATDGSDVKEITTSDLTCQFNGLQYDKEYYVYISSSNTNTGLSSKPYSVTITTIDYPTNLSSVAATDIIDNAARIRWSENGDYDLLKVIKDSNDSLVNEVTVTSDMKAVRAAIVDGLQPRTTYRVEAYKDNVYKGKKRFTTAAAENFSGAVIDLRAVVDSVGKTYITTEQLAADVAEYAGQDLTYVLKGGFDYKVSGGTALPATANKIKFVTGLTLAGNARFIQSGGFTMTSGAEINDVVHILVVGFLRTLGPARVVIFISADPRGSIPRPQDPRKRIHGSVVNRNAPFLRVYFRERFYNSLFKHREYKSLGQRPRSAYVTLVVDGARILFAKRHHEVLVEEWIVEDRVFLDV